MMRKGFIIVVLAFAVFLSRGVAAAQTQPASSLEHKDSEQFSLAGISCGQGRTVIEYMSRGGERVLFKEWRVPSAALVKKALALELKAADGAVQREDVLDENNTVSGARYIAVYKGRVIVGETRGTRLLLIEARTSEVANDLKAYLKRSGAWW